jgi:hypothetical protein
MATDEQGERPVVPAADEALQQLGIAEGSVFTPACNLAELANDALEWTGWHGLPPMR